MTDSYEETHIRVFSSGAIKMLKNKVPKSFSDIQVPHGKLGKISTGSRLKSFESASGLGNMTR